MNSSLTDKQDQPYQRSPVVNVEPTEHPVPNWIKLIFLIIMTFGLIFMVWFISLAIETMNQKSVTASYQSAGGILFGLFCFFVLVYGLAWRWGSGQREQMRLNAVEQQLARQQAQEALLKME